MSDDHYSYWSPPEIEQERIKKMKTILREYVVNNDNVIFSISKSGNDNFVAYKYVETDESFTVDPFWVIMNRESTLPTFESLSMTEMFLFGVRVALDNEKVHISFNPEQIRNRQIELILDSRNKPVLIGEINGVNCKLSHAYVQMQRNILPDVDYVNIYGTGLKDGVVHMESIKNS